MLYSAFFVFHDTSISVVQFLLVDNLFIVTNFVASDCIIIRKIQEFTLEILTDIIIVITIKNSKGINYIICC